MRKIKPRPETTEPETVTPSKDAHGVDLADAILDEIDAVLDEEDEFLITYRQKSGE